MDWCASKSDGTGYERDQVDAGYPDLAKAYGVFSALSDYATFRHIKIEDVLRMNCMTYLNDLFYLNDKAQIEKRYSDIKHKKSPS